MNRGSRISNSPCRTRPCRFNEAPIHESGKLTGLRRKRWTPPRFNEAPIHESGKSLAGFRIAKFSRFRFNEAPIHESGKSESRRTRPR